MSKISCHSTDFAPSRGDLDGFHQLDVPWSALIWSAITVGRSSSEAVLEHGVFSAYEIFFRLALVRANLREGQSGRYYRSPAAKALDPSEKSCVSYFLGLTMAKFFAATLLDTPWMMHLDVYKKDLTPQLVRHERPDLVGRTASTSKWIVAEAKGRTYPPESKTLENAKKQSRSLIEIGGEAPSLNMASIAYFSSEELQLRVADPPLDDEESGPKASLRLNTQRFFDDYYRPFRSWLQSVREPMRIPWDGIWYRAARVDCWDVTIGLAETNLETASVEIRQGQDESTFVGADGVLVRTGPHWKRAPSSSEPY